MKLNNTQINALASKFHEEIKDEIEKKNRLKKEKQLEHYRPIYVKAINVLRDNNWIESLQIKINKTSKVTLEPGDSFEDFTNCWAFRSLLGKEFEIPGLQDIKNDIIIATIDTSSVDEIMEKLKEKYK
jgi:argonaute-like protein implicated in RNA metabolism and viral defense